MESPVQGRGIGVPGGVPGLTLAQFGFVQPSKAGAVISVPMEGPAHCYQQGLCTPELGMRGGAAVPAGEL